ncbi:MAG: Cold-shock box protein [Bacteroidota bacterium]|jgi:ATP-dependent RNA helicase DeaD
MPSFSELGLGADVMKAVEALGFREPTPIQHKAIPLLLSKPTDLVALAQTGTGKTAAFGLPLIDRLEFSGRDPEALVLAPTRELCVQISNDLLKFAKFTEGASIVPVYGGANISTQIRAIRQGADIIVATPGRLIDLLGRKALRLDNVRVVILDEADEMLNMGFQEDIEEILSHTPEDKNTWLFSATMPSEIRNIAGQYMSDPEEIVMGRQNDAADNLEHHYYVVHERDRYAALKRLLDASPGLFAVVFCRTKIDTQKVAEQLIRDGYNADALHGDLSQQQRDKVMDRYRQRSLQVLVATDVAARGIDVSDITHVIHYHLPDEIENYTHRSGRTARAGRSGLSLSLINVREMEKIRQIERKLHRKFHLTRIPDALQIGEQQLMHFIHRLRSVDVNEKGISKYLAPVFEELQELSKEDLIKQMVSLEFNRFLDYYRNSQDLNVDIAHSGRQAADKYHSRGPRMFISLGSVDGLDKGGMLGYVLDVTGLNKSCIGRIEIKPVYAFVEFENDEFLETALNSFRGEVFRGRNVRVDRADGPGGDRKEKKGFKKQGGKSDFGKGDGYVKKYPKSGGKSSRDYGKNKGKGRRGG